MELCHHADCVNVDINQEATAYLMHTGQLSQLTSIGHGATGSIADILSKPSVHHAASSHMDSFTRGPNKRMPGALLHSPVTSGLLDSASHTPSAMISRPAGPGATPCKITL